MLLFTTKTLLGKLIFTISDIILLCSKVMERNAECYDASICKYVYMMLDKIYSLLLVWFYVCVMCLCETFSAVILARTAWQETCIWMGSLSEA